MQNQSTSQITKEIHFLRQSDDILSVVRDSGRPTEILKEDNIQMYTTRIKFKFNIFLKNHKTGTQYKP